MRRRVSHLPMRYLLLVLTLGLAVPAAAQDVEVDTTASGDPVDLPPNTEPFEVGIFRAVYGWESPAVVVPLRVVNRTAYPVYLGAAPALAVGALVTGANLDPAARLAVSQAVNFALTAGLKRAINRPRPYAVLTGVAARDRGHMSDDIFDPFSFPSGHTSSAFAIATSLSLSDPEWYVVLPSLAWAGTMGLARIWHGVHYPTDVLVGAAIGAASGAAVHFLMPRLSGEDEGAALPVVLVVPL